MTQYVASGTTISGLTVSSGDQLDVLSGGVAIDSNVTGWQAFEFVYSGGTSIDTTLDNRGEESAGAGGTAIDTLLVSGSQDTVYGTAIGTVIDGGEEADSGITSNTTVNQGLEWVAGGTAIGATVNSGGNVQVDSGSYAIDTVVSNGGVEGVFFGGTASASIVNSGGVEWLLGGTASGSVINSGGWERADSGTAANITVQSGGSATISDGCTAIGTTVNSGGVEWLLGGTASGSVINSGGWERADSGTAVNITVLSGGSATISDGCTAIGTTVSSGGIEVVSSGGTASNTTLAVGGTIDVAYLASLAGGSASVNMATDLLTVSEGGSTYTQQLAGGYPAAQFAVAADGSGGTDIILTAITPPVVGAGASASYSAGAPAVAIDPTLTVSDSETIILTGATVSITAGLLSGDELNFTNQNGITGSYNSSIGVLTLSGIGSPAAYQAALDSVTYSSPGDPTGGGGDTSRTISWSVADWAPVSNVATSSLSTSFPSIAGEDLMLQNSNGQLAMWQVGGTTLSAYGVVGSDPGPSWLAMGSGSFYSGDTSDPLWQNQDGTVAVWQVQGTSLGAFGVVANPGTAWHIDGTGNFYGAGGNNAVVLQNDNGAVALWELNGSSLENYGFAQYQGATVNPGPAWQVAATGTLDGGSNADIVLQNANGMVGIWEMIGSTIEAAAVARYGGATANPGPAWQVKGAGDYFGNGDSDSDIVLQNANGEVAIWEMSGATIEQAAVVQYNGATANPGPGWQVVGTGALSNGGTSDIVLRNTDGTVAVWEMSGASITAASVLADPGPSWGVIDGTMRFIDAGAAGETLAATLPAPDEFVFDSFAAGTHTITGFDPMRDVISFSSSEFGSYAAVAAATSAAAGGAMINLGGGSSLLLPGVDPAALNAGNFVLT